MSIPACCTPVQGYQPACFRERADDGLWYGTTAFRQPLPGLSCSADTLRRDLDQLCPAGYRVGRLLPCDVLRHTCHVGTLALLQCESD
jgi:hypothetical protein